MGGCRGTVWPRVSPLFRSMYGNEGAPEVVREKEWKMNTGLPVVKAAKVRNWQHNDKVFE